MKHKSILITAGVVAGLVIAYALAGFLWVPRLVQQQVVGYFSTELNRKATLSEVRFNPFTFELDAKGLAAPDADGARMLGFERLYVDFELSSIWHRAWTFREIDIDRPYGKVVQRADGRINFLDLVPAESPQPRAEEPSGLPSLRIGRVAVSEGHVDVEDRMRPRPFAAALRPITFELANFVTSASGNSFELKAGSDRAGYLALEGEFGLQPLRSKGSLSLTGIPATTISEYLEGQLDIHLLSGTIGVRLGYDFALEGQPFRLNLNVSEITVRGLKTLATGHEVSWEIPTVDVRDTRIDVARRRVEVGPVVVRDAVAPMWLDARGLSFPGVLPTLATAAVGAAQSGGAASAAQGAGAAGAATSPGVPPPAQPADWTVSVPDIAVLNARYAFEDRTFTPVTKLEVIAKELRLRGFALPTVDPVRIEFSGESSAGGTVTFGGAVSLEPLWADMEVTVDDLQLLPFQDYLTKGTDLLLLAGAVTTRGHLRFEDAKPEPRVHYAGDVALAGLRTKDRPLGEDFLNWKTVDITGLDATTAPFAFRIREITARDPYVKFVIGSNGITNVQAVLDPEGTKKQLAELEAAKHAVAEKPTGRRPAKREAARGKNSGKKPAPAAPKRAPVEPPAIPGSIGMVRVVNGSMNFSDFTVRPSFSTGIQQLNGTIKGLSSVQTARADVNLKGKVDRYAPVTIAGQVNPFAAESYANVQASFHNIELTSFNPYSFKFAGYKIDKGKLSVDTSYQVVDRRLDAKHHVVIDQFEFGERIESPDAIHLPLKLAVALLKDRNGVIDLELPITGTIDDPKFRIGPIIWKVLVNVLTKAVTAPFALLGSLFGGGDELQFIDFAPGSAELSEPARQKVASLQKAMTERPAIKLDIPSPALAAADAPVIAERKWLEALRAEQRRQRTAKKQSTEGLTDSFLADREEYLRLLEGVYMVQFGAKPDIPKPEKPAEGQPKVDKTAHAVAFLEPKLKERAAAGQADLDDLAKRRAAAVQDALLKDSGIDPARVFVTGGEAPTLKDGSIRMTLQIR